MKTWWLSFAGHVNGVDTYLGTVLVDGCEDFLSARMTMTLNGVQSPGGQCVGVLMTPDDVPEPYRDAFKTLPRLTVLSREDLRVLGPLVNTSGEGV
jgi:hypothetical protein